MRLPRHYGVTYLQVLPQCLLMFRRLPRYHVQEFAFIRITSQIVWIYVGRSAAVVGGNAVSACACVQQAQPKLVPLVLIQAAASGSRLDEALDV